MTLFNPWPTTSRTKLLGPRTDTLFGLTCNPGMVLE